MKVTQLVNLVAEALVIPEKEVAVPVEEIPAVTAGPLDGYKILVVDDEPDFVSFASAILEDHGASVVTAFDGDEALVVARRESPDLITLDITMPGKDGKQVFEAMRKDPALKSIPVCIITGQPELRKLIYDRSVPPPNGYVDKPISEETLMRNVRKILEIKQKVKK
jgi:CheY-like chemotaxis protein